MNCPVCLIARQLVNVQETVTGPKHVLSDLCSLPSLVSTQLWNGNIECIKEYLWEGRRITELQHFLYSVFILNLIINK